MSEMRANYPSIRGTQNEMHDHEAEEEMGQGLPIVPLVIFLGALVFFVGIILYAYNQTSDASGDAPFVSADPGDIMTDPVLGSGEQVRNLDSLVLDQASEASQPEQLLLPVEEPRITLSGPGQAAAPAAPSVSLQAPAAGEEDFSTDLILADIARRVAVESGAEPRGEEAAAPTPAPAAPAVVIEPQPEPEVEIIAEAPVASPPPLSFATRSTATQAAPPAQPAPTETVQVSETPSVAPASAPSAAPAPAPQQQANVPRPGAGVPLPRTAPAVTGTGTHWVQIAAVDSEAAARAEWQRLQERVPNLLGNHQLTIQTVSTTSGLLYRMRTGPMPLQQAGGLCNDLKAARIDCWTPPVQ